MNLKINTVGDLVVEHENLGTEIIISKDEMIYPKIVIKRLIFLYQRGYTISEIADVASKIFKNFKP